MSAFTGWYRRDECVVRAEFDPENVYVLDGGLATAIQAARPDLGVEGEALWSSGLLHTHAQVVKDAHAAFVRAGAGIILTDTYQCSQQLFEEHLEDLPVPKDVSALKVRMN